MILMSVSQHHSCYLTDVFDQVAVIGNYRIDAGIYFVIGKSHAAIDDYDCIVVFKRSHVLSYFADSAEKHDFQLLFAFFGAFFGNRTLFRGRCVRRRSGFCLPLPRFVGLSFAVLRRRFYVVFIGFIGINSFY